MFVAERTDGVRPSMDRSLTAEADCGPPPAGKGRCSWPSLSVPDLDSSRMSFSLMNLWRQSRDKSWAPLDEEFNATYMKELDRFLASRAGSFCPEERDIFKAFGLTALETVRVVILGEEPYSQPGVATGLCFAIRDPLPPGTRRPPSLGRVYNRLEEDIGGEARRTGNLEPWAHDDVLLMNTVLTVDENRRRSHRGLGWECFTNRVLQLVNDRPQVVFMLWGEEAMRKAAFIDDKRHCILMCAHPRARAFSDCNPFSRANAALKPNPIDWLRA